MLANIGYPSQDCEPSPTIPWVTIHNIDPRRRPLSRAAAALARKTLAPQNAPLEPDGIDLELSLSRSAPTWLGLTPPLRSVGRSN